MTAPVLSSQAPPILLSGPMAGLLLILLVALAGLAVLALILAPVSEDDDQEPARVWTAENAVPSRQAWR